MRRQVQCFREVFGDRNSPALQLVSWRKLHISVDPASSEIRTHELSGDDTADATMAGPLVAGSGGMIRRVFADGAYQPVD